MTVLGQNLKVKYFIKGGDYKSICNGTFAQRKIYINKDNKVYSKISNSEIVFWNDASVQGDEILKAEINKNVIEILGHKCDGLILTCKSGSQKYYFNSNLSVNSKLFANHKFGNRFDYLLKSNALPLKCIIETAKFTLENTAIEVKSMMLDNKIFELPTGTKTEKSSY